MRNVRRKLAQPEEQNEDIVAYRGGYLNMNFELDWTALPEDVVIRLFTCLNFRDRASLSSTCRALRLLGTSPCLWDSLDLRFHKLNTTTAESLSSRTKCLRKLWFRAADSAEAIIGLQARELREITGDYCQDITDAMLSVIAARHEMLESIQLGPEACQRISNDAIKAIAVCCPKLKKLQLSYVKEVNGDAINALARHCKQLMEVAFMDADSVDATALINVTSLQWLSVSGTRSMKWDQAVQAWGKMPGLMGLDVSATNVSMSSIIGFLFSCQNLKVIIALGCSVLEAEVGISKLSNYGGKYLLTAFSNIPKITTSLFADTAENKISAFPYPWKSRSGNGSTDGFVYWIEWVLSHSLLRIAETTPKEVTAFWIEQGIVLLLNLLQSSQVDVQERAATALATFAVLDDENAVIDNQKAEEVERNGGVRLLLDLARSSQEGLQSEATKAIANLSVNATFAKAVAENGGIEVLTCLAGSLNQYVAEEAAGGLWNLSVGEDYKGKIADSGGVRVLVDLLLKWPSSNPGVLERAAGALANLAGDHKSSIEVAAAGGIQALVKVAVSSDSVGVQEQVARALANLAAHGDSNDNNAAVGQEAGALKALVKLTYSEHEGVRHEAAGALWHLSFNEKNREAIAKAGGITALVTLATSCLNASQGLQERVAGALWGLSALETNSVAIGEEGSVAPLIALARSDAPEVHENSAGTLWNLAFNPDNARRIVQNQGVQALVHLCSTSSSKMARFMAALALAYVFDGSLDEFSLEGFLLDGSSQSLSIHEVKIMALKHIKAFVLSFTDRQIFSSLAVSSSPAVMRQVAEVAHITEAGHLRCSQAEITRLISMLRNPSRTLQSCSAFALLQFTMPGGRYVVLHRSMLQNTSAQRVLQATAAASTAPIEARFFTRVVLSNLELQHPEPVN